MTPLSSLRPGGDRKSAGVGRPSSSPVAQPGASQSVSASPTPCRGDTPSPATQHRWPGHPLFVWQEESLGRGTSEEGPARSGILDPTATAPRARVCSRLSPPGRVPRLPAPPAPLLVPVCADRSGTLRCHSWTQGLRREIRPPPGGASPQGSSPDPAWRGCPPSQAASGTRSSASASVSVEDRGAPGLPTTGSMTAGPPCPCR